ncbi:MAG: DUF1249 domain-containing protein [Gammaproteobacteria bacterium]|nr:DUF1249 domain-containing protein [Gammaproteobacteria bacterium]
MHKIPPHLQACHDVRRESFAALMDLYENNYLRLKKLIPWLADRKTPLVSTVVGCLDLHLQVLEQSKFTTLINLTYCYRRQQGEIREPDLKIRIYHDVGLAEAISGSLHHGRLSLKNIPETAIMERWHLNRFLYKWLGFSLHIGHRFGVCEESADLNRQINRILSSKI